MIKNHLCWLLSLLALNAQAELTSLDDDMLAGVDGGNSVIAAVFDDVYIQSDDAELVLDFDSGIPLRFNNFYWLGHDAKPQSDELYGATIGSAQDPFFIAIQQESVTLEDEQLDGTAVVIAMPEGDYKQHLNDPNAGRMDLGVLMTLEHQSGNTDETWLLFNGMDLDGSYIKFWAPDNGGLAASGELNFHADELIFQTGSVLIDGAQQPSDDLSSAWKISQFDAYVPLGNTLYQPLTLNTDEDQQLVLEIAAIDANSAERFYSEPLGHISADNITINDWDAGSSYIEGIQVQHMRVQTHDLN